MLYGLYFIHLSSCLGTKYKYKNIKNKIKCINNIFCDFIFDLKKYNNF